MAYPNVEYEANGIEGHVYGEDTLWQGARDGSNPSHQYGRMVVIDQTFERTSGREDYQILACRGPCPDWSKGYSDVGDGYHHEGSSTPNDREL